MKPINEMTLSECLEALRSKTLGDFAFFTQQDRIEIADRIRDITTQLESEITRLQEKYDENGYDCSPMIKLQRMEQHIDSTIKYYADRFRELNRWISVDERWPETEDVRGDTVLVYSTCGRYWKTVDGPQNN